MTSASYYVDTVTGMPKDVDVDRETALQNYVAHAYLIYAHMRNKACFAVAIGYTGSGNIMAEVVQHGRRRGSVRSLRKS